jgi:hypothetical protein
MVTVVLVLLLALAVVRGRALLGPDLPLNSHGETSFGWAYRNAAASKFLRDSEPSLKFGEILWITVPASDPRYDPGWFTVMANYSWPHQSVLGVSTRAHRRNGGVTIVEVAAGGIARILRTTRSRNASP